MDRVQTYSVALAALLMAGAALPAHALQLGEAKAQIVAKHGAAGAEDRSKNIAIYFWAGWSAEVEFKDETVQKLVYRRNAYLEAAEVNGLLQSNGGTKRWQEMTAAGAQTRQWVRDDGATASCLAARPLMMTFEARRGPAFTAETAPQNVVPPPSSSTPARFPKLLGSNPEAASEAAAPEAPNGMAPLAAGRSLPKLQAAEVPADGIAPPTKPTYGHDAKTMALVNDEDPATAPTQHSPTASESGGSGWIMASLAFLTALAGGVYYWFKIRPARQVAEVVESPSPAVGRPTPAPARPAPFRPASPPSTRNEKPVKPVPPRAPAETPASLDAVRNDQFELYVGEVFRREGYTVELSAAAAQDDVIDLTLRRDSETILVQCKHWKTPRVTDREVCEFHRAMMSSGAPRGIFVTAGSFTKEAQVYAETHDIDLMDRAALEESIALVSRPGENFLQISGWIEEFASSARIFDPECPTCQGSMTIRYHRANGTASWNCRNHPRCPGRREPRLDLLAISAAQ